MIDLLKKKYIIWILLELLGKKDGSLIYTKPDAGLKATFGYSVENLK
jgi:hypothetical protein